MVKPILVSVITPTLNRANLLERTLRSVRAQSYANVEHIVVDGGSDDGTVDLLRRYESTYGLRWVSEPDSGMYAAINKGLRMARGEVLAYLNSDDAYMPWTLDAVVSALEQIEGGGLVFGDAINIAGDGRHHLILQPPFSLGHIKRTGFLVQPSVFWSRAIYSAEGGFDERLRYVADCDFWMRAGARWPVRRIDEVLCAEFDHPGTLRAVSASSLRRELELVRRRHGGREPLWRLLSLWDRLRSYLLRRILLVRFLVSVRRAASPYWINQTARPWGATISAMRPRIRLGPLLSSLMPITGRREWTRALEWRREAASVVAPRQPSS